MSNSPTIPPETPLRRSPRFRKVRPLPLQKSTPPSFSNLSDICDSSTQHPTQSVSVFNINTVLYDELAIDVDSPDSAEQAPIDKTGSPVSDAVTPATDPSLPRTNGVSSGAVVIDKPTEVDDFVKVYTFFSTMKRDRLRLIGKAWKRRSFGNKPELLYRNFLYIKQLHRSGKDFISVIESTKECPSYKSFLEDQKMMLQNWKMPPSDETMLQALTDAGDKPENQTGTTNGATGDDDSADKVPNFTLSEFARLIVILKEDERAKVALLRYTQELTRSELDCGMTRDSFWELIADRFNDPSVHSAYNFAGVVDGICSSDMPPCKRSASTLKNHFNDSKSVFTKAKKKWDKSGQNDPDRFRNFLSKSNGEFYAVAKRALILFTVSKLGTPYADTSFVQAASKLIEGIDGGEAGIRNDKRKTIDNEDNREDGDLKRRRRGSSGKDDDVTNNIKELNTMVKSLTNLAPNVITADSTPQGVNTKLNNWKDDESLFAIVESALNTYERAKERGTRPEFLEVARKRYEAKMEEYRRLSSDSS